MRNYDFKVLSPIDFENLVRDLLQKQLKITLETFSSGRDTGIDFRYTSLARGKVIVQCKHTPESNFTSMLSGLRRTELPKVQKLSPDRYIFATSQPLTPPKKQRIIDLFSPFILKSSDVYGREDLNNLLGKFRAVERDHVKLWISNSLAMERFLHARRLNLSREARSDRYRFRKTIRDRITREFLLKVEVSLQLPSYGLTNVWNKGKYIKVRRHVPLADRISQIASVARDLKTKNSRELLELSLMNLNQAIDSNLIQPADLVSLLNNLKGCLRRRPWADLLSTTKAFLTSSLDDLDDYQALIRFNRSYPRVFSGKEFEELSASFPKFAEKFVSELTTYDPDDLRTYMSEIGSIGDELGVDVDVPLSDLEDSAREAEALAEEEEKERERNDVTTEPVNRDDFMKQVKSSEREVSDHEINSIFNALV